MNVSPKRCPLPFLILLTVLWIVRSMTLPLSQRLPARELTLVEAPEKICVQVIPGRDG